MTDLYSTAYYQTLSDGSWRSAEIVAPLVIDLLHPKSVVDVGCGTAAWAAAFKGCGVPSVLGIDGDYVDRSALAISADEFLAADLTRPLALSRRFDLAVTLEVAEHLLPEYASEFVHVLTQLAPAVLFSAAIPQQGGEHHVNEQWPQYWTDQFDAYDFVAFDVLRPQLWSNPAVDWWYAQNMLLFVRRADISQFPQLHADETSHGLTPAIVHPRNYLHQAWRNRVYECAVDLATVVAANECVLLVDEDRFGGVYLPGRIVRPFPEVDGIYGGPPCDDQAALEELARQQKRGAKFIAIGWPAFWWLGYYSMFAETLRERHKMVVDNERLIVFMLGN